MDESAESLWEFVDERQLHVFRSEKGYWVAFDPLTQLLACEQSARAAVAALRRLVGD